MLSILDYLYFKLYRAVLVGSLRDNAEFAAMVYFGGLIAINLIVIGVFLNKINVIPLFLTSKKQVIIFVFFIYGISYFIFLYNKRYKKIIFKYEQETDRKRKRGNLLIWT
jgi:hypothetical protein